jgi:hypothetical protein
MIDFEKTPEEQLAEETGPALERPDHYDDELIDGDDGFEPADDDDLAEDDAPVENEEGI